jgi:tRNA pseudouridine38-40 synthase
MSGPFRMVALWCWYRGAGFHGYQAQRALHTVQGELLAAFAAAGLTRNPVVAGRTDRGVSARMQVLSARLAREVPVADLAGRLGPRLPPDLGLHLAREAPPGFHAAWSASGKAYRYHLSRAEAGDLGALEEAAALVPGTRDFSVFHFKTSEVRPRTVHALEVVRGPADVTLRFEGHTFGRHMVRMLVGGLTAVARGEVPLEAFRQGLLAQRRFHCPVAPPEPLTLWSVEYPLAVDPFTPAERAGFHWDVAGGPPTVPPSPA